MKTLAFDLDGTLAPSKQPIPPNIAQLLARLSHHYLIAIISGADWPQFLTQVLPPLKRHKAKPSNLYFFPTSGTKQYRGLFNPTQITTPYYLTPTQTTTILNAFTNVLPNWIHNPTTTYGPQIENRETQITFSALGQSAPLKEKTDYDPTHQKRQELINLLLPLLPTTTYTLRIGGTTSIDITQAHVDKTIAINAILPPNPKDLIFFGDSLQPGGNDHPVIKTGVKTKQSNYTEIPLILKSFLPDPIQLWKKRYKPFLPN